MKATARKRETGILRLDFSPRDEALEEISSEEFFETFDKEKLAFLHQDETEDGSISCFHKFVERPAAAKGTGSKGSGAKGGAGKSAGRSRSTASAGSS